MTNAKTQLEKLVRIQPDNEARQDCLRLDLNENVTGLPEVFVRDVLSQVDAEFLCTYPKYNELMIKIAKQESISRENICLGNGSDGVIKYIFETYIQPNDKVLMTNPTFAMYNVYCCIFGAQEVIVDYNPDLSFPTDAFLHKLDPSIKLAVIVNPNNPTGTVLDKNELVNIITQAEKTNTLLLIDEAYYYYFPDTMIQAIKEHPNLMVLRTFSKLCAVAAARIGYTAAHPQIIKNLEKIKPTYDINGFGILFANNLLDNEDIIVSLIDKFIKGRVFLNQKLTEHAIPFRATEANFTLIDVGDRVQYFMERLKAEKVLVGGGFTQEYLKKYIRVTIADEEKMEIFMNVFLKVWEGANNE